MLANKRIIKAKGLEITPISSTGIIIGYNQTLEYQVKICFQ